MMESPGSGVEPGEGDAAQEPVLISVRQFVTARVAEITSLTAQIGASGSDQGKPKGFSFQHVSKHMRRRAVSHNPKRLPSRLRQSHFAQLRKSSGGLVKKPKRPNRKYRKRSDGDILEYNRRQMINPKWLESHIWHAKRFHMKAVWNRKIAISPTAKCFRSLFRAARQSVIMQDISYLSSFELSGPMTILSEGMPQLTSEGFSKTPNWNRELLAHMISPATSTYIGPLKYLWLPTESTTHAKLLIWMHPTIKFHVLEQLQNWFGLTEKKVPVDFPEFPTKDEKKHLWKLASNQCWANVETQMVLKDLSGCLNRIRLVGLKTLTVLKEILKVGRFTLMEEEPAVMEQQQYVWNCVQKLVNVPNSTVIPLNVIDPRLELPKQRSSMMKANVDKSSDDSSNPFDLQSLKPDSPLWHEDMWKLILRKKTSDEQLSLARSNNLIPGTAINDGNEPDVIPIALVIRSDNSHFLGADLILPCSWLMPFWIALSYRCVRSYALEFSDYLTFEEDPYLMDLITGRLLPPDSIVYAQEKRKTEEEARAKYFSYPPAKRHNLIKLGCAFPFSTDWPFFLRWLSPTTQLKQDVHVVRKREDLQILATCLHDQNPNHPIFNENLNHLFPVQVVLLNGVVENGACICIPNQEDLKLFSLQKNKLAETQIIQSALEDTNEKKRAELSRVHHKRLSNLRKKRKKARRAAQDSVDFDLTSRIQELDSKRDVDYYNKEMENLWLSDNVENVLSMQTRDIMGFTEYAHYSFVRGKSAATGYVTVGQLKRCLELHLSHFQKPEVEMNKCQNGGKSLYVLVRNWSSSLTYRWAKLEIPNI